MTPVLDVRGLACPLPRVKAAARLREIAPWESLVVLATDPDAPLDLAALASDTGRRLRAEPGGVGEFRVTLAPRVRPIGPDEAPQLRELRLRALVDAPESFGSTHAEELDKPADHWIERARPGADAALFVVSGDDDDGVLCAMAGAFVFEADVAIVWGMWVAPQRRGEGLAAQLLDAVLHWARARGLTRARLWVSDGNDAAHALYLSAGFEAVQHGELLDACRDLVTTRYELAL